MAVIRLLATVLVAGNFYAVQLTEAVNCFSGCFSGCVVVKSSRRGTRNSGTSQSSSCPRRQNFLTSASSSTAAPQGVPIADFNRIMQRIETDGHSRDNDSERPCLTRAYFTAEQRQALESEEGLPLEDVLKILAPWSRQLREPLLSELLAKQGMDPEQGTGDDSKQIRIYDLNEHERRQMAEVEEHNEKVKRFRKRALCAATVWGSGIVGAIVVAKCGILTGPLALWYYYSKVLGG